MDLAHREYIAKLCRVANAAKTLTWVRANIPGDVSEAICWTEIHQALKDLDSWDGFDPRASLEYYRNKKG